MEARISSIEGSCIFGFAELMRVTTDHIRGAGNHQISPQRQYSTRLSRGKRSRSIDWAIHGFLYGKYLWRNAYLKAAGRIRPAQQSLVRLRSED
jgi:hypothetical protein